MPVPPPEHAKNTWHGSFLNVWTWDQQLFDGTTDTFECVTRPDTVSVIAFVNADTILLTHQTQPHRTSFKDMPGGRVDPGETFEEAARRELEEETGYRAQHLVEWNALTHQGMIRFEERLFIATGLTRGFSPHLDAGERVETIEISWQQAVELALRGELRSSTAMLALLQMAFHPESKARLDQILNTL